METAQELAARWDIEIENELLDYDQLVCGLEERDLAVKHALLERCEEWVTASETDIPPLARRHLNQLIADMRAELHFGESTRASRKL